MTANESSSTFTRRKFTLTEALDARLVKLANQHYQGNVSLCLRAAIEDHESTLNDSELLTLHQIEQQIKSLETEIQSATGTRTDETEVQGQLTQTHEFKGLTSGDGRDRMIERVFKVFQASDSSLRIADIVDQLDGQPEAIIRACGRLIDFGYLVEAEESSRYRLPVWGKTDDL
jgi:hypothetical protein